MTRSDRLAPVPGPVPAFAGLVRPAAGFVALLAAAALVAALVGTGVTGSTPVVGIVSPPATVRFGIPIARTLVDLGAAAAVGIALLSKLVGFDRAEVADPVLRRARPLAAGASLLWAAAALASILLLAWEITSATGDGFPSPDRIWAYVAGVPAGKGLLLSAGCGLVSACLCLVSVRRGENVPAELRIGIAMFGLLPLPLTGHASDWYWHDAAMISMELHVVAATAWAGGLAAVLIFLARSPALLSIALPRFSTLATWCVFLVGFTGLFNGLAELALSPVGSLPESLWQTKYGVLVLAKAACMAAISVTALVVRRRVLPRVAAGRSSSIALWCGWELLVLAIAFGVAAVLTRTSVSPL